MKFGEKIKLLRTLDGITQTELAARAGLQQSVVARHERGDVVPYSSPLERLASALNEKRNIGWLKGKAEYDLGEGFVYFRPMSPFAEYASSTIRGIDNVMVTFLPAFIEELRADCLIYKSALGSILVCSNKKKSRGIIISFRAEIAPALDAALPEVQSKTLSEVDFLNALIYSDELVLRNLGYSSGGFSTVPVNIEATCESVITLRGDGIPKEVMKEMNAYLEDLFNEHGLNLSWSVESDDKGERPFEQLIDPKLWRHISDKYRIDTTARRVFSLDE